MRYEITTDMIPEGHQVDARDTSGHVVATFLQPGFIDINAELTFATVPIPVVPEPTASEIAARKLPATDAGMSRVVEDLITVLAAKGVMRITDLPASAQAKLTERTALRQQIQRVE